MILIWNPEQRRTDDITSCLNICSLSLYSAKSLGIFQVFSPHWKCCHFTSATVFKFAFVCRKIYIYIYFLLYSPGSMALNELNNVNEKHTASARTFASFPVLFEWVFRTDLQNRNYMEMLHSMKPTIIVTVQVLSWKHGLLCGIWGKPPAISYCSRWGIKFLQNAKQARRKQSNHCQTLKDKVLLQAVVAPT